MGLGDGGNFFWLRSACLEAVGKGMLMGLCRTWFEKDDDVDDRGDICCSRSACLEAIGMRN